MISSEEEIQRIVRKVVERTLGGERLTAAPGVRRTHPHRHPPIQQETVHSTPTKKIVAIGADHGGVELKETLKTTLAELGFDVVDCGTNTKSQWITPICSCCRQAGCRGKGMARGND